MDILVPKTNAPVRDENSISQVVMAAEITSQLVRNSCCGYTCSTVVAYQQGLSFSKNLYLSCFLGSYTKSLLWALSVVSAVNLLVSFIHMCVCNLIQISEEDTWCKG